MKLFELEASLALNTSGFVQDIGKARSEMLSLSDTTRQETSSITHMLEDTFSFSAGQLLADGIRNALPVVVHRRSREPWLVTMDLTDLLEALSYERPCNQSEE